MSARAACVCVCVCVNEKVSPSRSDPLSKYPSDLIFRLMRSRQFGLDKHWLLMADLEQREKSRRENLKNDLNSVILIFASTSISQSYLVVYRSI